MIFRIPFPLFALASVVCCGLAAAGCNHAAPPPAEETFTGPGWFTEVTADVGLDFVHDAGPVDESYFMPQIVGSGAAIFFDGDGTLCIYLLQNGGPRSSSTNRLYRRQPDGKFKDASAGSGLDIAGFNQGVAVGDVNNDGWPDVLVTQYGGVKLFLNNGDGTFTDATKESGLDVPGWSTSASFFDYDRDGFLDLVVVRYVDYEPSRKCANPTGMVDYCAPKSFSGTPSKLFHNCGRLPSGAAKGPPPVRFEDVSLASGLAKTPGPGLGVLCADFNGDGWPDIFIANDGQPNHLWINQKNGTFQEEAVKRGLAYNAMGAAEANMGIAWGDVDGDGLMDLFVTHLNQETNTLWKQGPRGKFKDQTAFSGLALPHWRGTGFGTALADFDLDGALDVAVVNGRVFKTTPTNEKELGPFWSQYADRNQLFANDGTGKFRDVSLENAPFCQTPRLCRCLAVGDVDGDGALDLLVTQIDGPVHLYRNVAKKRGHWLMVRAVDPELKRDAYGAEITIRSGEHRWTRLITADGGYLCSNDPRAHFGLGAVDHLESVHVLWPDGKEQDFACGDVDRVLTVRKGEKQPKDK